MEIQGLPRFAEGFQCIKIARADKKVKDTFNLLVVGKSEQEKNANTPRTKIFLPEGRNLKVAAYANKAKED